MFKASYFTLSLMLTAGFFAGAEGRDLTFFVWSDSHHGACDYTDTTRLAIVADMNNLPGQSYPSDTLPGVVVGEPTFILHCGDLTEHGYASEWDSPTLADQRSYLQTIAHFDPNYDTYECLGNHDLRYPPNTIRSLFVAKNGGSYYSFSEQGVHLVVLDPYPYDNITAPELDSTQLSWLENDLDSLPEGTPIIIAMHIHPNADASNFDGTSKLGSTSSAVLWNIISDKNVLTFFHGHGHRIIHTYWNGVDVLAPAGYAYSDADVACDVTGLDPTFGVVRITDDRVTIFCYDWSQDQFWTVPLMNKSFTDVLPCGGRGYPVGDISGSQGQPDCYVDLYDLMALAAQWLICNDPRNPTECPGN